jgi:ribosomal protein S27E
MALAFYSINAVTINPRLIMDIIFNCPNCEQELEVDASGAGSEIECPSCEETILIPQPGTKGTRTNGAESPRGLPTFGGTPAEGMNPANPISTSAAAKVEMHLKVPVRKTSESLISKPKVATLEGTAKSVDKVIRVKTIRHTDCIEVGHDKFDEFVTNFLQKVGQVNIISITPLTYTHVDIGSQKVLADYAVMVVYKG